MRIVKNSNIGTKQDYYRSNRLILNANLFCYSLELIYLNTAVYCRIGIGDCCDKIEPPLRAVKHRRKSNLKQKQPIKIKSKDVLESLSYSHRFLLSVYQYILSDSNLSGDHNSKVNYHPE